MKRAIALINLAITVLILGSTILYVLNGDSFDSLHIVLSFAWLTATFQRFYSLQSDTA
jgi:hypothetical protein